MANFEITVTGDNPPRNKAGLFLTGSEAVTLRDALTVALQNSSLKIVTTSNGVSVERIEK